MPINQLPLAHRLVRMERFCERVASLQHELKRGFKHSKYLITLFNQGLAEQGGGKLRVFDHRVNYYDFTYERHIVGAV